MDRGVWWATVHEVAKSQNHLVTQPQSVNPILLIDLSLTLSPLIATSLFSMSVNLFLFCK